MNCFINKSEVTILKIDIVKKKTTKITTKLQIYRVILVHFSSNEPVSHSHECGLGNSKTAMCFTMSYQQRPAAVNSGVINRISRIIGDTNKS